MNTSEDYFERARIWACSFYGISTESRGPYLIQKVPEIAKLIRDVTEEERQKNRSKIVNELPGIETERHVSTTIWNRKGPESWLDRNYRLLMMISMAIELILLTYIAFHK